MCISSLHYYNNLLLINPLSATPTKWSNTLNNLLTVSAKLFVCFTNFVGWTLNGLNNTMAFGEHCVPLVHFFANISFYEKSMVMTSLMFTAG